MCQCRFIDYDKCTGLVENADDGEAVWSGSSIWALSAQLHYKPKTTVNNCKDLNQLWINVADGCPALLENQNSQANGDSRHLSSSLSAGLQAPNEIILTFISPAMLNFDLS